jgi:hypothetical protein
MSENGCGCLQIIEGVSTKEQLHDMCRLLDFLAAELATNSNFEFFQALLRLTLQVCSPLTFVSRCVDGL